MRKKEDKTAKKPENTTAFVVPVLLGSGIAMLLLFLLALVMSGLIWSGALPASNPSMFLTICAGVCAFIGGRIAIQKGSGQPILLGVGTGVVLCIILVAICLGNTGKLAFYPQLAGTLLMILAGGAFAGLLGRKKRKKKK